MVGHGGRRVGIGADGSSPRNRWAIDPPPPRWKTLRLGSQPRRRAGAGVGRLARVYAYAYDLVHDHIARPPADHPVAPGRPRDPIPERHRRTARREGLSDRKSTRLN